MLHFAEKIRKWVNTRLAILGAITSFGVPLAIYLAFPNNNYNFDALTFIMRMGSGSPGDQFYPHHLVYNTFVSCFSGICQVECDVTGRPGILVPSSIGRR